MNELALFAGAGGGILGGRLLGWRTICAVELDAYARKVLLARQKDGTFPPFPIWDDIQTFDGRPWAGKIDVISGGFPCQDVSAPGSGAGITGEKSGLWMEMERVIGEVRPRCVFVENSPMLTVRGLGSVLGGLASLGYDARWGVLGANAASIGAPHRRDRIWVVAHTNSAQREGVQRTIRKGKKHTNTGSPGWWSIEPELDRVAYGVAYRAHRLRATGNGQVPAVAALAWRTLSDTHHH
jgi:DNA (cytosine-5)-methyltransferase 1